MAVSIEIDYSAEMDGAVVFLSQKCYIWTSEEV